MPYDYGYYEGGDDYEGYDYGYSQGGGYQDYYYDYPEEYQGKEDYYEAYEYPYPDEYSLPSYDDDEYAGYGGKGDSTGQASSGGSAGTHYDYDRDYADYTDQGSFSFTDGESWGVDDENDSYARTVWRDILQGGLTLLIFVLALLPPLVYFFALIKIKEGHISWLYQTTLTLIVIRLLFFCTLGPDGPQIMYGLSIMTLIFAAASAAVLYNKGTPRIDDYIVSAFSSTGESTWQRWLKFYSIVLVYVGLCPLLWFVL